MRQLLGLGRGIPNPIPLPIYSNAGDEPTKERRMRMAQFRLTRKELRDIQEFCGKQNLPDADMRGVVTDQVSEGGQQEYYMGLATGLFRIQQLLSHRVPEAHLQRVVANLLARTVSLIEVPPRDEPSVN